MRFDKVNEMTIVAPSNNSSNCVVDLNPDLELGGHTAMEQPRTEGLGNEQSELPSILSQSMTPAVTPTQRSSWKSDVIRGWQAQNNLVKASMVALELTALGSFGVAVYTLAKIGEADSKEDTVSDAIAATALFGYAGYFSTMLLVVLEKKGKALRLDHAQNTPS